MKTNETQIGTVLEIRAAGLYLIDIDGTETVAYLSGRMRKNHIKVLVNDKVEVVLDPYGGKVSNRIVRRI